MASDNVVGTSCAKSTTLNDAQAAHACAAQQLAATKIAPVNPTRFIMRPKAMSPWFSFIHLIRAIVKHDVVLSLSNASASTQSVEHNTFNHGRLIRSGIRVTAVETQNSCIFFLVQRTSLV